MVTCAVKGMKKINLWHFKINKKMLQISNLQSNLVVLASNKQDWSIVITIKMKKETINRWFNL